MTFEIFVTCFFGNELTVATTNLSTNLFHSNWMDQSKEFKTAMKMLMENAKKPAKISVFGIFDVSLENFLKIMNSTFSLYAGLKSLK